MSRKVFRVSEINKQISLTLESQFPSLWIKGELSNFVAHSSGHWYFSLKEEQAQISGVMFRRSAQGVSFSPEGGQEVVVKGKISVYAPRGTYQIICESMELAGEGKLQQEFEKLKQKLKAEGLFDSKHKKPIPDFPRHIAVITSPTGAAIRDIVNVLHRRFRSLKITLIPAVVQGEQASKSLIQALGQASLIQDLDACIIGRGGGSLEDLWAFNNEELARAVHHCSLPIISAVGHEIDFTICDFVADLRAPTPSAAAELVVKNSQEVLSRLENLKQQFFNNLKLHLKFWKERLDSLSKQLVRPESKLQELQQKTDDLNQNLIHFLTHILQNKAQRLMHAEKLLASLDPCQIMQRGFCIARDSKNKILNNSKNLKLKQELSLQFFKGSAKALVTKKV